MLQLQISVTKGLRVEGVVSSMALLAGAGAFKSYGFMRRLWVPGGMASKGIRVPQFLHFLFPGQDRSGCLSEFMLLPECATTVPKAQKQQGQMVMDRNLKPCAKNKPFLY